MRENHVIKVTLFSLACVVLLVSCYSSVSESQIETAVAEAVKTSAVLEAEQATYDAKQGIPGDLEEAYMELTQQAEQLSTLQAQIDFLQTSPTPTITITSWATGSPTPTKEPQWGPLPNNQKVVAAKGNAPWYRVKGENKNGYPVMVKTNPIKRFTDGQTFWVYKRQYQADGGAYFYKISGPSVGIGYYVRVGDVKNQ